MKIYSYIVAKDYGLAPNPFWGELTLNVCKPKIRQTANVDDWVIGTGSKNVKHKDGTTRNHSGHLVYAMKVTKKMTMCDYDNYTKENLKRKIPYIDSKDWRRTVGDSLYDYSQGDLPRLRKVLHKEKHKMTDLGGEFTLLSTDFYYFGAASTKLLEEFLPLIKKEQGHLVSKDIELNQKFVHWLTSNFESKKLYGDPQLQWQIKKGLSGECEIKCDN